MFGCLLNMLEAFSISLARVGDHLSCPGFHENRSSRTGMIVHVCVGLEWRIDLIAFLN